MARVRHLIAQVEEKKSLFGTEFGNMTELERLEFEFDWVYSEIERLEKEGREIGLKLAKLKGEGCSVCRVPLIRKDEKEKGVCAVCFTSLQEFGKKT